MKVLVKVSVVEEGLSSGGAEDIDSCFLTCAC